MAPERRKLSKGHGGGPTPAKAVSSRPSTVPTGAPGRSDSPFRWLLWAVESPIRWVINRVSLWAVIIPLLVLQGAFVFYPAPNYPTMALLILLPVVFAHAIYASLKGSRARWYQVLPACFVAGGFGFVVVLFFGALSGVLVVVTLPLFVAVFIALLIRASGGAGLLVETEVPANGFTPETPPKVGGVYWGEVINTDGLQGKWRPVVVTRVIGSNAQVLYSTSQEHRGGTRGYVQLTREGWKTDERPSFVNVRDPRILLFSQLGKRIGELSPEDRSRVGLDPEGTEDETTKSG